MGRKQKWQRGKAVGRQDKLPEERYRGTVLAHQALGVLQAIQTLIPKPSAPENTAAKHSSHPQITPIAPPLPKANSSC